jgi:hypothetical protein
VGRNLGMCGYFSLSSAATQSASHWAAHKQWKLIWLTVLEPGKSKIEGPHRPHGERHAMVIV